MASPAGMTTKGMPCRLAIDATSASEPSPPAMPSRPAPPRHRILGQLTQVVARIQNDWFNASLPTQIGEPKPLGLAATGPEVHQEDGVVRPGSALVVIDGH